MSNNYLITLIRHGETIWNKDHRLQGRKNISLSARGIEQAHEMAEALKSFPIDFIGASPLTRTQQTASIIAKALNVPSRILEGLKPRSYGPWEGKSIAGIREDHKELFLLLSRCSREEIFLKAPLESIESYQTVADRALQEIIQIQSNALLITHSGVITSLCLALKLDSPHIPLLGQMGYLRLRLAGDELTIEDVKGLILPKQLTGASCEPTFIF